MPTCGREARWRACLRRAAPSRFDVDALASPSDLEADGEAGLNGGHRLLKDRRDILADDLATLGIGDNRRRSRPFKGHLVGRHLRCPRQESHHGEHRQRICPSRISHGRLPCTSRSLDSLSRHAIDRPEHAGGGLKLDDEIFDFKKSHRSGLLFSFGSRASRRPSPTEDDRVHGDLDGHTSKVNDLFVRGARTRGHRPAWCPIRAKAAQRRGRGSPGAPASRMAVREC